MGWGVGDGIKAVAGWENDSQDILKNEERYLLNVEVWGKAFLKNATMIHCAAGTNRITWQTKNQHQLVKSQFILF